MGIGYQTKSRLLERGELHKEIERRLGQPENRNKTAQLRVRHYPDKIAITIEDMGRGFDPQPYLEFSRERAMDHHGRGIMVANKMSFDALHYGHNGRRVTGWIHTSKPG